LRAKKLNGKKTLEDGMKEAAKTGKPIMLDFYTDW
jgi:thiol:disulfide interchange protein